MGRLSQCLAVLAVTLLPGVFAIAAEPGLNPDGAAAKPSAAELVEGIIAQESKVDSVESLYLRFEGKWTHPRAVTERRVAKWQQEHPGEIVPIEQDSSLWPELGEDLELAFDKKRLRKLSYRHQAWWELRVFDGQRKIEHIQNLTSDDEHYYLLDSSPERILQDLFGLGCPLTESNRLGFLRRGTAEEKAKIDWLPTDYTFAGVADFRGRRCYLLKHATAWRRLHIGVDDRRLHGLTDLYLPTSAVLQAYGKLAGRSFAKDEEVEAWLDGLTIDVQTSVSKRIEEQRLSLLQPLAEQFMDDYRELVPGLWMPATQGYELSDDDTEPKKLRFGVRRELHLVDFKVNKPLADSLFTVKMVDGVDVMDFNYDPPLTYPQKADRTPEEWQLIVGDRKLRSDDSNEK